MALPLKTFVFRLPATPIAGLTATSSTSLARTNHIACFSTSTSSTSPRSYDAPASRKPSSCLMKPAAARQCLRSSSTNSTLSIILVRQNSNLSSAARKTSNMAKNQPVSDLATDAKAAQAAASRIAQSTTPSSTSTPSTSTTPNVGTASATPSLNWNDFFKLRLRRRRIQLLFSVTSGLIGSIIGAGFLSTGMAEPLVMQIPLDPFVTLGLMTVSCGLMGWLAGPSIGSQVFYIANRKLKPQIQTKEAQFFARVKRNRVDPSNSSAGNPVPDFYGEKISSVAGYRQWLKDQRAFNKKKSRNFL